MYRRTGGAETRRCRYAPFIWKKINRAGLPARRPFSLERGGSIIFFRDKLKLFGADQLVAPMVNVSSTLE